MQRLRKRYSEQTVSHVSVQRHFRLHSVKDLRALIRREVAIHQRIQEHFLFAVVRGERGKQRLLGLLEVGEVLNSLNM